MTIKKIALALGSAFMLLATTLNAQENPWSFGAKVGGSMSWLSGLKELRPGKGQNDQEFQHKTSAGFFVTGGLTAGYAFHENVGIGLEVNYANLTGELETTKKLPDNASQDDKDKNKPNKLIIQSHNIAVPLMLKVFPMGCDPDEGILALDLGIQFEFPLAVSAKKSKLDNGVFSTDLEKFEDSGDKSFDKSKQFNSWGTSLIGGLGYEFPGIGLTLEGRYHLGLKELLKSDDDAKKYREEKMELVKDKNVKNQYFTVAIGYNFARLLMD